MATRAAGALVIGDRAMGDRASHHHVPAVDDARTGADASVFSSSS